MRQLAVNRELFVCPNTGDLLENPVYFQERVVSLASLDRFEQRDKHSPVEIKALISIYKRFIADNTALADAASIEFAALVEWLNRQDDRDELLLLGDAVVRYFGVMVPGKFGLRVQLMKLSEFIQQDTVYLGLFAQVRDQTVVEDIYSQLLVELVIATHPELNVVRLSDQLNSLQRELLQKPVNLESIHEALVTLDAADRDTAMSLVTADHNTLLEFLSTLPDQEQSTRLLEAAGAFSTELLFQQNGSGRTAFYLACRSGNLAAIKHMSTLLDQESLTKLVNIPDEKGVYPLWRAFALHLEVYDYCQSTLGIDIKTTDFLHFLAQQAHDDSHWLVRGRIKLSQWGDPTNQDVARLHLNTETTKAAIQRLTKLVGSERVLALLTTPNDAGTTAIAYFVTFDLREIVVHLHSIYGSQLPMLFTYIVDQCRLGKLSVPSVLNGLAQGEHSALAPTLAEYILIAFNRPGSATIHEKAVSALLAHLDETQLFSAFESMIISTDSSSIQKPRTALPRTARYHHIK